MKKPDTPIHYPRVAGKGPDIKQMLSIAVAQRKAKPIPKEGTSFEVGATAIFKGAAHPNAARLWVEFCLTPEAVNLSKTAQAFQFLVLKDAEQPEEATRYGLDPDNVIE